METKTKILLTKPEVRRLIQACKKTGYCCFDFETNAEPIYNKSFKPTILSISFQPSSACSVVLDHFQRDEYKVQYSTLWVIKKIGHELIEDYKVVKCAWNLKFDAQVFMRYNIFYRGTCIDGMLAKYILNEEKPNDLKSMVRRYLPESGDYEKADNFDKIPWDKKELEPLCHYGGQDTDYTLRLCIFFEQKLISLGLYSLFRNLIMSASRVLTTVERNGLYVDREFNNKLLEEYKIKINESLERVYNLPKVKKFTRKYQQSKIEEYINAIQDEIDVLKEEDSNKNAKKIASREQKIANIRAGIFTTKKEQSLIAKINLGSPVDLPALIYGEYGFKFKCTEFTDKGKQSTSEDTLKALRLTIKDPESPKAIFLDTLMDLRGLEKMYTTFIEGWHDKVQDDNKLHGSFKIHGCVTGNTQLIGKESDIIIKDICPKEPGVINVEKENIWVLSSECTWEQVTHTINKGKLPTYKIITSTGETLECTEGHRVLTTRGWKTVKQAFKKGLSIIMYDTSKFDITKPTIGKKSSEVVFKEVSWWPGYLVTNEGKVYSVKVQGGRGILDYNHPHELVPRYINDRPRVYFRNNTGKKTAFSVAHLVWLTFNNQTNIPSGMVIDHINGDPMDNRPENLQCITASENIKRAYSMTRSIYTNGSKNGTNKFDTLTVGMIIEDYSNGITQREICIKYNISQKQVSGIVLKQRRKEIYLTKITSFEYIGERYIYDLSVNNKHSYITRSNFINSNTTSGRLSSSEPNLQQIPKVSVDQNIKKQLIAKPGTLYLSSDFSQAELRIMAHLSKDETYLRSFNNGEDPHLAIACQKYHVDYNKILPIYKDEQHPEYKIWSVRRKQAKQLAFGLIYGIGPGLLAEKLSDPKAGIIVSKEEAKKQMDEYFEEHPALEKFKSKQERTLRKYGFLTSLFGRKRRLPQIYSENTDEEAYAVRLGLNFPCQSAASDMCLFGSILIYYLMRQGKLPKMDSVTLVHDANYMNTLPENINVWSLYSMWEIFRNPSTKEYFGFQISDITMDMDYHVGRTMAEELPIIPGYDYRKMLDPNFSVDEYMDEYKRVGEIQICDYPKLFPKEMAYFKEQFKLGKYGR